LFGSFFGFFSLRAYIKTLLLLLFICKLDKRFAWVVLIWYWLWNIQAESRYWCLIKHLFLFISKLHESFALCTLHQCWFGIESFAYQLGPSIGYCIKLGISHTHFLPTGTLICISW
jgi:hypothetical protein